MVSEVIKSTHSRLCEELSLLRFEFETLIEEILCQKTDINERTRIIRLIGHWWTEAASCKDGMNV